MAQRLITRAKLCEVIQITDSSLRKFISRNVITQAKKGFIDIDDENNKIYILNYASRKGIDCEELLYGRDSIIKETKINVKSKDVNEPDEEEKEKINTKPKLSHSELQQLKTEKEVEKLEVETRLKNLELQKKKAKVLPLDFVIDWSALNIRGVFGETVNFGNSMIEQICNELDADINIKLKYKKQFKQGFNEILKAGISNQKPEAIAQAKEYSLLTKW